MFEAAPTETRRIWKVGELVGEVRGHIEREYADLWVEGEISNLRPAPSGHLYFTLKDGDAQLPVVLFRRQASLLRFRPDDGLQVLLRGKVSVYEQRGQMQIVAEFMEPVGAGSLQIAFEQLKARLQQEGLFDQSRKKALPAFPRCVGIITSPTGAVIRDFLNVAGRRHAALDILLYPAVVQGESASAEVAAGIAHFNGARTVDVIVIARGGGSLEDLAPFNSESLARAIAASRLPIVSAIGHETDFTIADFVADLRAPTPSAAAELITGTLHKVEEHVELLSHRLQRACRYRLMQARENFARLTVDATFARLREGFGRRQQRVDELRFRMEAAWNNQSRGVAEQLHHLSARLLRQDATHRLHLLSERLSILQSRLFRAQQNQIRAWDAQLQSLSRHLTALSPLAVLNRGYALVFDDSGALVKDASSLSPDQRLTTRFAHGSAESQVTKITPEADAKS
jgi:exodeoxyribonuclease VII large subunit